MQKNSSKTSFARMHRKSTNAENNHKIEADFIEIFKSGSETF
jgi:hypothetical protein